MIDPEDMDQKFVQALDGLVTRLANTREPAVKVPFWSECQFCDTSAAHCPERVEYPGRSVGAMEPL